MQWPLCSRSFVKNRPLFQEVKTAVGQLDLPKEMEERGKRMNEAINWLTKDISNLMIGAGLIFLAIGIVGKISGKIDPGSKGRIASCVLGTLLLLIGLLWPSPSPPPAPGPIRTDAQIATATLQQMGIPVTEEAFLNQVNRGNADTVKLLLAAGIKPNTMTELRLPAAKGGTVLKVTALTTAVMAGHKGVVQTLVDAGADVNREEIVIKQSKEKNLHWGPGSTPLMIAAEFGKEAVHVEIASILIKAGAKVNVSDSYGQTPLHLAARESRAEIVRLLLEAGAEVDARTDKGFTPLMYAAYYGQVDSARNLISAGADVNARNKNDDTPLLLAVWKGHKEVAQVLIDAGADVNVRNKNGLTVLTVTADPDFLRLLRNAGARP